MSNFDWTFHKVNIRKLFHTKPYQQYGHINNRSLLHRLHHNLVALQLGTSIINSLVRQDTPTVITYLSTFFDLLKHIKNEDIFVL